MRPVDWDPWRVTPGGRYADRGRRRWRHVLAVVLVLLAAVAAWLVVEAIRADTRHERGGVQMPVGASPVSGHSPLGAAASNKRGPDGPGS